MEELLTLLKELKPDVDFEKEEDLVAHGILDSIEIMELTEEIMDRFDVDITPLDIVPENFASIDTLYKMIKRLKDE